MAKSIILMSVFLILLTGGCNTSKSISSPLFIDPNYHGSCDPEIIFNEYDKYYYIYYTARRSVLQIVELEFVDGEIVCDRIGMSMKMNGGFLYFAPLGHKGRTVASFHQIPSQDGHLCHSTNGW